MLDRIRALLGELLARQRKLSEIARLSDRDLADLGVSRDQAERLAALPDDVPGRVLAMARIFDLTEADLTRDRGAWDEVLTTCHACRELAACRRLLARGDRADPTEAAFCPNAAVFAL